MKMFILAVHDRKIDEFNAPYFAPTLAHGVRSFEAAAQGGLLEQFPEDFSLHSFGEWDSESGRFDLLEAPKYLMHAPRKP